MEKYNRIFVNNYKDYVKFFFENDCRRDIVLRNEDELDRLKSKIYNYIEEHNEDDEDLFRYYMLAFSLFSRFESSEISTIIEEKVFEYAKAGDIRAIESYCVYAIENNKENIFTLLDLIRKIKDETSAKCKYLQAFAINYKNNNSIEAIELMNEAANEGYLAAQQWLYKYYLSENDKSKAITYLDMAGNQRDYDAFIKLAKIYLDYDDEFYDFDHGMEILEMLYYEGVDEAICEKGIAYFNDPNNGDRREAFSIFDSLSERYPLAVLLVSFCYKYGEGTQINTVLANRDYYASKEFASYYDFLAYGDFCKKNGKYIDALDAYYQAFRDEEYEEFNSDSACAIGDLLLNNSLCSVVDYFMIYQFYLYAFEQKNLDSLKGIKSILKIGCRYIDLPPRIINYINKIKTADDICNLDDEFKYILHCDFNRGSYLHCYVKALLGDSDAQVDVAGFYAGEEKSIEPDFKMASYWLDRAIENKCSKAYYLYGKIYEYGLGTKVNYNKALKYYSMAYDNGDEYSSYNLGCLYYYGRGVEKNKFIAHTFFKASVNSGVYMPIDTEYYLAMCYSDPELPCYDMKKAIKYFEKAALCGHDLACYEYGVILYEGKYIKKDLEKAKKMLINSSDTVEKAKKYLKDLGWL